MTSCCAINCVTSARSLTLPRTSSYCPSSPRRLSILPVKKSSRMVRCFVSVVKRRTRLAPTKPAPPVTSTRLFANKSATLLLPHQLVAQPQRQVDDGPQDAPPVAERLHLGCP